MKQFLKRAISFLRPYRRRAAEKPSPTKIRCIIPNFQICTISSHLMTVAHSFFHRVYGSCLFTQYNVGIPHNDQIIHAKIVWSQDDDAIIALGGDGL